MAASYWILLFLSVAFVASVATHKSMRTKRGIEELAGLIKCSTRKNAINYVAYGCYCGLGGQGWPKDKADWCCFKHDCCYGMAEKDGCHSKTVKYDWKCDDETPECEDLEDKCQEMLCKCDRDIARCLRKAPYKMKYSMWPDFLCIDAPPMCKKKM